MAFGIREKVFFGECRRLARWFIDHQDRFEAVDADFDDLANALDAAVSNWMDAKDPRK